ncbi:hypothetical protein D3C81_974080 [compost metagenome]
MRLIGLKEYIKRNYPIDNIKRMYAELKLLEDNRAEHIPFTESVIDRLQKLIDDGRIEYINTSSFSVSNIISKETFKDVINPALLEVMLKEDIEYTKLSSQYLNINVGDSVEGYDISKTKVSGKVLKILYEYNPTLMIVIKVVNQTGYEYIIPCKGELKILQSQSNRIA